MLICFTDGSIYNVSFSAFYGHGLFFDDLLKASSTNSASGPSLPQTGSDLESMLLRSCYVCHGTSISAVTSSCWETVDEDHTRFVSVRSCLAACAVSGTFFHYISINWRCCFHHFYFHP